jgi:hypothetical protein
MNMESSLFVVFLLAMLCDSEAISRMMIWYRTD